MVDAKTLKHGQEVVYARRICVVDRVDRRTGKVWIRSEDGLPLPGAGVYTVALVSGQQLRFITDDQR